MADVIDNQTAKQFKVDRDTTGKLLAAQGNAAANDRVSLAFNDCTTATTVGANGTASALPTPLGYVEVVIGGAVVKLAYYNT